jgi:phage portal protein BeeE
MWASGGASVRLVPDLDNLPALATEREALWSSLEQTSFLTTDEKRAIAGFSPAPQSDEPTK